MSESLPAQLSRLINQNTKGNTFPRRLWLPPAMLDALEDFLLERAKSKGESVLWVGKDGGTLFRGVECFSEEGLTEPRVEM